MRNVMAFCAAVFATTCAAQVPTPAYAYLPTLRAEIDDVLPTFPVREYFGGLIDHESGCPGKSCWRPTARLKTPREEGAGLTQITRTYNSDGSPRFDALADIKRLDQRRLRYLSWDNIYARPDLQMRAMLVLMRQNFGRVNQLAVDKMHKVRLTDLSYNAGLGRVLNDMRACSLMRGCDPQRWYGHVELSCTASRRAIYGSRSACDISRHHVHDVVDVRAPRYRGLL